METEVERLRVRVIKQTWSETHYSLKEMETPTSKTGTDFNKSNVGNPLLSERDGNSPKRSKVPWISFIMSETHYSLKEMETSYIVKPSL